MGDAAYVLNAMLPMIEDKKHPDWMKMIHEWQAQDYHPVSDASRLMPHPVSYTHLDVYKRQPQSYFELKAKNY